MGNINSFGKGKSYASSSYFIFYTCSILHCILHWRGNIYYLFTNYRIKNLYQKKFLILGIIVRLYHLFVSKNNYINLLGPCVAQLHRVHLYSGTIFLLNLNKFSFMPLFINSPFKAEHSKN